MSKYVKQLVTRDIQRRLEGVNDAVLVCCTGLDAIATNELRGELAEKDINMYVVKNSLARRATEGTSLAPAFEGASGPIAICYGGSDFVTLVKEVVRLDKDEEKYEAFTASGGVMDGEALDADGIKAVSKWPTREEQISSLVGSILGPGATLNAALLGPGKTLNSQLKKKGEEE